LLLEFLLRLFVTQSPPWRISLPISKLPPCKPTLMAGLALCNLLLLLVLLPMASLTSPSAPCYFPDGTYIDFDAPCFPDRPQSFCCGRNHTCMSNGLCRWPDAEMPSPLAYIRGSCTDRTWNSPECPQHCANKLFNTAEIVTSCPSNQYCCSTIDDYSDACCAGNSSNPGANPVLFGLDVATTVTVIGAGPTKTSGTSSPTSSSSTTTSSPSSSPKSSGMHISVTVGVGGGAVLAIIFAALLV